jgi:hypothetical protein
MNRMKRELCFLSASDYWAEWSSAPLPMTLTRRPCSPSAVRLRFRAKCCRREPTYSSARVPELRPPESVAISAPLDQ